MPTWTLFIFKNLAHTFQIRFFLNFILDSHIYDPLNIVVVMIDLWLQLSL